MRRIRIIEHISLDGVIQGPGGPDLILQGRSRLAPLLLHHGLADEVLLPVFPVPIGRGKRFFPDLSDARELTPVTSKAAASGVLLNAYRPAGPMRAGSFGADPA